jgi:hypothetical protein
MAGEQEQIESGRSRVRGILMRAYVSVHQCAKMYVCIKVCVRESICIYPCMHLLVNATLSLSLSLSLSLVCCRSHASTVSISAHVALCHSLTLKAAAYSAACSFQAANRAAPVRGGRGGEAER